MFQGKDDGAILVFLPGYEDIAVMRFDHLSSSPIMPTLLIRYMVI